MKEEFIKLIKNGLTRKNDTMIANVGVDGVINFCKEEWRDTKEYKNYKISNYCRLYSIKNNILIRPSIIQDYLMFPILGKNINSHRLVMNNFSINHFNLSCVNHKDECKTNNFIGNLEFCSEIYNLNYSRQTGMFRGFPIPQEVKMYIKTINLKYKTKHKIYCYDKYLNLVKIYDKISDVKDNDFSISCVCRCCKKTYGDQINFYKGFFWSYKPIDVGLIFSFNDRLIFS